MRNRSGVFAANFLASCKDLFSIICIYFSLGERPEKKPRYLLCGLIICGPRKAIFGEKPGFHLHCQVMKIGIAATDALKDDR